MDAVSKERFPDLRELIAERFDLHFPPELGGGVMPTNTPRCDCTEDTHPCVFCELRAR